MKRFTDTEKWRQKNFRKLKPVWKLVLLYYKDACDNIGVIDIDRELVEFSIGQQIDWSEFEQVFDGLILPIYNAHGIKRYWMPLFIHEQCGELTERCAAHKAVIRDLSKWRLLDRYYDWLAETLADANVDDEQAVLPGFGEGKSRSVTDEEIVLICDRWNTVAKPKGLAEIVSLRGARRTNYLKRLKDNPTFWPILQREIPILKPFACGDSKGEWSISFNYCVESQSNFDKIREGTWRSAKLQKEIRQAERKKRKEAEKVENAVTGYVELLKECLADQAYTEADMVESKRSFAREWGTEALEMVEKGMKEAS